MKPYQRRAVGAYPYFKRAEWDAINQCWRDGRDVYDTAKKAKADLPPGRYRLSKILDRGRNDLRPFEVI